MNLESFLNAYDEDTTLQGTAWESNRGGGEIFLICPDRPWGPLSLLYNGYWVSFLGVKRPGCGVYHPLPI
jgi:hypothetical protein